MKLTDQLLSGRVSTDQHPVRAFIEAKASIERTLSHFRRTSNGLMRRYLGRLSAVLESYTRLPTDAGGDLLCSIAADCDALFEASQGGDRATFYATLPDALNTVTEAVSLMESFGPRGTGTSGTRIEECKYESEHEAFVRKFDKRFKVKHDHLELLNEGLFVYYDKDDTNTLLALPHFDLASFSFEEEYILLRRGSIDDFDFGPFGEAFSKWGFVYSPGEGTTVES